MCCYFVMKWWNWAVAVLVVDWNGSVATVAVDCDGIVAYLFAAVVVVFLFCFSCGGGLSGSSEWLVVGWAVVALLVVVFSFVRFLLWWWFQWV
jgi:hypothetical protein